MIAALAMVCAACSSSAGGTGSPGGGLSASVDVQAMTAAWASGKCPVSGQRWGGFDYGIDVPSEAPSGGRTLTVVPAGIDRIMLCRFSDPDSKLTGSAVLTSPDAVSRIARDLNSATPGGPDCAGTQHIVVLAGTGRKVIGIDVANGDGCTGLTSLAGPGDYGKTSLDHDMQSALSRDR